MSYILAIEPDPAQASTLRRAFHDVRREKILIVSTKEAALGAIDRQVPDLVLLHSLMPPGDDEHMIAYLGTLPGTRHVQVIRIPQFQSTTGHQSRTLAFGRLTRRFERTLATGCDPRLFAEDVAGYLAHAHALKKDLAHRTVDSQLTSSERRRAYRWSPPDVPWVSSVRLAAGERADLIDISLGGALVRTPHRPELLSLKGGGFDVWTRPGLMLQMASGEKIRVTGEVVRCQVASGRQGTSYQVAFRFDESADLYLPMASLVGAGDWGGFVMASAQPPLPPEVLDQWSRW